MEAQKNNESGMMAVEAVLSFMVFLMAVLSIISLINVFMVHNKVQAAINSAAHELASYTYLYEATGLHSAAQTVHADGAPYVTGLQEKITNLTDTFNKMQKVYTSIQGSQPGEIGNSVQELQTAADITKGDLKHVMENPKDVLAGAIYMGAEYAAQKLSGAAVAGAVKGLSQKYLVQYGAGGSIAKDADAFLTGYGIKDGYAGLDFSGSSFLQDDRGKMIDVMVSYDMEISFLKILKKDPSVRVIQRTTAAAWLDGDGKKLSDYGIKRK